MKEYFSETTIDYSCKNCLYNGKGKETKKFYNSPQYLILDFEGHKNTKDLDLEFDVSQYIITSIGPRKYQLYAFIFKQNGQYKAYIRNNNLWYEYSGENDVNENRFQSFNSFSPNIAIYRGI
jgi:ubiquitin C-terminal hydrolase